MLECASYSLETTVRMPVIEGLSIRPNMPDHQVKMSPTWSIASTLFLMLPEDPRMICSPHLGEHAVDHLVTLCS
jgi:hypothetical protein